MKNTVGLQQQFQAKLAIERLVYPGEKVYVACSGGPDSVALIHLFKNLPKKWKLKLGVLHVNHGLRGKSSDADEKFVSCLAEKLEIPFLRSYNDVKKIAEKKQYSTEEAAREGRYEALSKMLLRTKHPKIAVAHNLNDQAETLLMRMIQGTGSRGLLGIRKQRKVGKVIYVRPLLSFSKEEILNYLDENKLKFRKDKSNLSKKIVRNKIRLELLPYLEKEYNPRVVQALARIPSIYTDEQEVLVSMELEALEKVGLKKNKNEIVFSRHEFSKLPAAIQFRVLNQILKSIDERSGLGFDQWSMLREELTRKTYRHSLLRDIDIDLTLDKIRVYKKKNVR